MKWTAVALARNQSGMHTSRPADVLPFVVKSVQKLPPRTTPCRQVDVEVVVSKGAAPFLGPVTPPKEEHGIEVVFWAGWHKS